MLSPYIKRLVIVGVISLIFGVAVNEAAYYLQREYARAPKEIQLEIPSGTAERIANSEPVPSIPEGMVFVLGDELVVENQDSVNHELGPLFIPPGTSASLKLDSADNYALSCTFSPTNYLGIDVREPTTGLTRFLGLMMTAPVTAVLLFLYSLVIYPIAPPKNK